MTRFDNYHSIQVNDSLFHDNNLKRIYILVFNFNNFVQTNLSHDSIMFIRSNYSFHSFTGIEFDINVYLLTAYYLDTSISVCNSNESLWLNMFRLKANASNRNGICNMNTSNGNVFPNMFSLSSLALINNVVYNFHLKIETINDNIVLQIYELLIISIISIIVNSSDNIQWNKVISKKSIDSLISDVYNNSKGYTNSLLTINIIIQTLYDILTLKVKNANYKNNDILPISLIIFQIENITHDKIELNVDYTINVTRKINGVIPTLSILIRIEMINSTYYLLEFKIDYIISVLPENVLRKDLNYILNECVQIVFDNIDTRTNMLCINGGNYYHLIIFLVQAIYLIQELEQRILLPIMHINRYKPFLTVTLELIKTIVVIEYKVMNFVIVHILMVILCMKMVLNILLIHWVVIYNYI